MGRRALVTTLPPELQQELEQQLIRGGFGGYAGLSEWLAEKGFEISVASLSRYGRVLSRRVSAIKASTQAAQMICEAAKDEEDHRSESVLSMVQSGLFDTLVALEEASDEAVDQTERLRLLTTAARAIADVSRASIGLKRYQAGIAEKTRVAAEAVARTARQGGMSQELVDDIRSRILGIAA
jgi:hypothetical protein